MSHAYIALGSNVGDRRHYLQLAIDLLSKNPKIYVERVSGVYRSLAMTPDGRSGPEFLNAACCLRTTLRPRELFYRMRDIEARLGRVRHHSWAPRTIDLDVLSFDDCRMDNAELIVPHPRLADREFVLRPLAEIAPRWRHSVTGKSIADLLEALADSTEGGRVLGCCGSLFLSRLPM